MKIALIADDEPLLRRQVIEVLNDYGFDEIIEAENGSQAVDLARIRKPLLSILDVSMPVMNGLVAAEKISKMLPGPIIMLTAAGDVDTIAKARDAGVAGYVMKPVRPEQLYAAVDLAIHHFVEVSNLKDEVEKLKDAIETRKLVDRAKALLIKNGLGEPEAYRKMQKIAMDKRKTMKEVAEAILLMEG
ncbi:MAG: response regulator [Desulfuromonas sp.]|nr:MAG: response regulator [Desulfuromonas sp.]